MSTLSPCTSFYTVGCWLGRFAFVLFVALSWCFLFCLFYVLALSLLLVLVVVFCFFLFRLFFLFFASSSGYHPVPHYFPIPRCYELLDGWLGISGFVMIRAPSVGVQ